MAQRFENLAAHIIAVIVPVGDGASPTINLSLHFQVLRSRELNQSEKGYWCTQTDHLKDPNHC
jgi:hypothetical protein